MKLPYAVRDVVWKRPAEPDPLTRSGRRLSRACWAAIFAVTILADVIGGWRAWACAAAGVLLGMVAGILAACEHFERLRRHP